MHNVFKCLKTLLFFNSNMNRDDIEVNDLLFLETLFIENYPIQDFSLYMKEDVKKLLVDSFGKDYLEVYIRDILYNLKEVNKKEKVIAYYEGVQKS